MIRSRLMLSRGGMAFLGVVSLLAVGAGCGGSSGETPADGGGTDTLYTGVTTSVAGCNEFATLICNRDKSCNAPDAGAEAVSDCVRLDRIGLSCDQAPATLDFKTCLNDVQVLSCDSLFNGGAPNACVSALNMVPLSDAQTKCQKFVAVACQKSGDCHGLTLSADDLNGCVADNYDVLGCGLATSVGTTYDQCLLDLTNAPCPNADGGTSDGGGSIPSCETAITFAE